MTCANCGAEFTGSGYRFGTCCSRRCAGTAGMRAKRQADPQAYRDEMRRRREDPDFKARQDESRKRSDQRNAASIRERSRARHFAERVQNEARRIVRTALRRGVLEREPCLFCDGDLVEAHHHDYSQPLAVTWLCQRHHALVHRLRPDQTRRQHARAA